MTQPCFTISIFTLVKWKLILQSGFNALLLMWLRFVTEVKLFCGRARL